MWFLRQLAEAETEQQRLADAEEYEKAAELSVDIESLKAEAEHAVERLRCVGAGGREGQA